jgi:hypothetical protein
MLPASSAIWTVHVGRCKAGSEVEDKQMIKTVEAVIDERGNVTLLEPVSPGGVRTALVTILEERPTDHPAEPRF